MLGALNILTCIKSLQHYIFPIESAFDSTTNMCLIDAMSCQKDNLLKVGTIF